MELRPLRFFIAVYEERNITNAARRCFVSQPAISSGIKQLEDELETTLFLRHKKGVDVTDEAHYLYPHALRLVEDAKQLPALFQQRGARKKLTLAIMPDLSRRRLGLWLGQQIQAYPQLDLELTEDGFQADARITLDALRHEDELFLPLWEEDYVLCAPISHPLALREQISTSDLHQYDFIECPPCEARPTDDRIVGLRQTFPEHCGESPDQKFGSGFSFGRSRCVFSSRWVS